MSIVNLDLKGLKCPFPALKTRKALKGAEPGTVLRVICTDPLAAIDIPALLNETGDVLMAQEQKDGALFFTIKKT